jgi:peptidoglycan/LPS O-acetylase OafA/YrhL
MLRFAPQAERHIRLDSIEVCRGIAATMVLFSHCGRTLGAPANFGQAPFGQFFQFGRSGVDFFFVLSGFLIALLHWSDIGRPDKLKRYSFRRVTRIYPTYWLFLLAIIPFDVLTRTLFDSYGDLWEVAKSILLLPQKETIVHVTWSLRNELLFYVLFGLLIWNRGIGATVAVVWIAVLMVRPFAFGSASNPWTEVLTAPMNFEFLAGVALGWAFPRVEPTRPGLILGVGLLTFLGLWYAEDQMWMWLMPPRQQVFVCLAYSFAACATLLGLCALELGGRLKMPRPLVLLGGASYLLYLVHVPALLILGSSERHLHLLRFLPVWLLALGFVVGIIAGTLVVHVYVERPLLRAVRPRQTLTPIVPASALV